MLNDGIQIARLRECIVNRDLNAPEPSIWIHAIKVDAYLCRNFEESVQQPSRVCTFGNSTNMRRDVAEVNRAFIYALFLFYFRDECERRKPKNSGLRVLSQTYPKVGGGFVWLSDMVNHSNFRTTFLRATCETLSRGPLHEQDLPNVLRTTSRATFPRARA